MLEIVALINVIKSNPKIYVECSVSNLHCFIQGFYNARRDFNYPMSIEDYLWVQFDDWINRKYLLQEYFKHIKYPWYKILKFRYIFEFDAYERFFDLWEEYLKENNY